MLYVSSGATLVCSAGSSPSTLTVTDQHGVYGEGSLMARITDKQVGTFGICSILTSQAGGNPTPCSPSLPSPWQSGKQTVYIGGDKALLKGDTLPCSVGGTISITNPNITTVKEDS